MRQGLAMGLAMGLAWSLLATPSHALETTYRLGVPYFMDPGVGGLFPGGQRLGGGAEWTLSGPWSLSLDTHWLHQDWGATRYTLSLTPLLFRHRLMLGQGSDSPFLTFGLGGAAMALMGGGESLRVGLGPAFAAGIGLPMGQSWLAQLELQQGAINAIHYVGFGLSLGMRVGGAPPSRMRTSEPKHAYKPPRPSPKAAAVQPSSAMASRALKPPLPQGQLLKVGKVAEVRGDRVTFSVDDLPYRVQPGDVLVIYYQDGLPIKVAKVRVETVSPDGRAASGNVLAATEAIRRGYFLGTL